MAQVESQSIAEDQKAFEFVNGSLIIIVLIIVILFFFQGNLFSSLALTGFGAVLGGLYSRHKYQRWSLFVVWKASEDAKYLTIAQRFLSLAYVVMIWAGLVLIDKYVRIGFEMTTGILEVMVACYLGYFVWLLWLHKRGSKVMKRGS